jgi:hypothetical protein
MRFDADPAGPILNCHQYCHLIRSAVRAGGDPTATFAVESTTDDVLC